MREILSGGNLIRAIRGAQLSYAGGLGEGKRERKALKTGSARPALNRTIKAHQDGCRSKVPTGFFGLNSKRGASTCSMRRLAAIAFSVSFTGRVRPGVGRRRDGGHHRADVRRRNGASGALSVSLRLRYAVIIALGSVRATAVRRLPAQEWRPCPVTRCD
jgi:hypothetical protein